MSSGEDITERRRATQRLRENERVLSDILESTLSGYWDWNIPEGTEYLSPAFKRMFGYEEHELPDRPESWQNLVLPEDLPDVLDLFDRHVESHGDVPFHSEVRYRHKDGSTVWVICAGRVIEWADDGTPVRMVGCHVDITERKRAEEALEQSRERLRQTLDATTDGIWTWNFKTNELSFSPRYYAMLGYEPDAFPADFEHWVDLLHPDDREAALRVATQYLETKPDEYRSEFRLRAADGSYRWLRAHARVVERDANGDAVSMIGNHEDITSRMEAAEAVRLSEERFRSVFEQSAVGIALAHPDGRLIQANRCLCEMVGYSEEELLSTNIRDITYPEDLEVDEERIARVLAGEIDSYELEKRYLHKSGRPVWGRVYSNVVRDATSGEARYAIAAVAEITEEKSTRERTERLLARQTAVNELALALGAAEDRLEVYRILYSHISALVNARFMHVVALDEDGASLRAKFAVVAGKEREAVDPVRVPLDPAGRGLLSRVVRTGTAVLVEDYAQALRDGAVFYRVDEAGIPVRVRHEEELSERYPRSAMLVPMKAAGEVVGVLQVQSDRVSAFSKEDVDLVAGLANVAAVAERNARLVDASRLQAAQLRSAFDGIVETVSATAEIRDPYTAGHQKRVAELATAIARGLGMDSDAVEGVRVAGLVHDIGKLGIPVEILSKPVRLTETEIQIIETHVENAFRMLQSVDFPWPIAETVYQHHERLDGSGYPRGLRGDQISLEARILGVADVVEAMASHRPYRPALGLEQALGEIETHKGSRFDPRVVDACLLLFRERGFAFSESAGI